MNIGSEKTQRRWTSTILSVIAQAYRWLFNKPITSLQMGLQDGRLPAMINPGDNYIEISFNPITGKKHGASLALVARKEMFGYKHDKKDNVVVYKPV